MRKLSNFDFLKDYDNELYELGNRIEDNVTTSPPAVKSDATPFLQKVLKILLSKIGVKYSETKNFYNQLDAVYREGVISYGFKQRIYGAYRLRSRVHDNLEETQRSEYFIAQQLHEKLFYIAKKLYRDFSEEYDEYKGVPVFKPIEIDTSDDEVELVKIPDFSEIIDIRYDYCVICGEPNHSNYSICCPKCNRVMDNANNFISIRNSFGKEAKFTKEDLIEYGIPEGYVNQLVSSMVREDMIKVKGRYITFNNMHLDEYLAKIDSYISVCELITKFREDKITASEVKQTNEYKYGSYRQDPFYQFYKIINHEVIDKFERDLLTTKDIEKTIEYTTITQKQLQRWYLKELGQFKKGNVNESFVVFNDLLKEEYINLKSRGVLEKEIKRQLNISPEVYGFWQDSDKEFIDKIECIKKDLIIKAMNDDKTRQEIIEIAGVTPKEYDDIFKVADFKGEEISKIRNRELESRKEMFVKYLKDYDIAASCELAKITVDDFYGWYDKENLDSSFYRDSTMILMYKYLQARKESKTQKDAALAIGLEERYVDRWLRRKTDLYKDFNDANLKVIVDLIIDGFENGKSKEEIEGEIGISVNKINVYLDLSQRGSALYEGLFESYETHLIPMMLDKFMEANKNKSMRKALEISGLTEKELDYYYELGKNGDEAFEEFHDEFLDIKKATYVHHIKRGKSHKIAMRESRLTEEEYDENRGDMERLLRLIKITIVAEEIANDKTSSVAASKAGCSVDEIYEWYFKGRDGDEEFERFYNILHNAYVRPSVNAIQDGLDNKNYNLDNIIRSNKDKFTKKDVDIWLENGLIEYKAINLDKSKTDDDSKSEFNANKMLREMGIEDYDRISVKKGSASSSILNKNDVDVEKLKKQILKK